VHDAHAAARPRARPPAPSRLERPHRRDGGQRGIEAQPLEARDAGQDLAADAARPEQPEAGVAARPDVSQPQRPDPDPARDEPARLPLRDRRVAARTAQAPEGAAGGGAGYGLVDRVRDIEAVAPVGGAAGAGVLADVMGDVITDMGGQVLPDRAGDTATGATSDRMICSASVRDGGLTVAGRRSSRAPYAIQMQSARPDRRPSAPDQSTMT
jgi:hypothetical protein